MYRSNSTVAETRAALAALNRLQVSEENFDCFLLVDDSDEAMTEITSVLRERSPRGLEVQP
jgi:ribonuclease HI